MLVVADDPAGSGLPPDISGLYRDHAPFIGRVIKRLTGDGPHVDDLLQETFIVAFKKLHTYDRKAAPGTWLYGIASRLCARHRRSLRRFRLFSSRYALEPAPAPAAGPESELERAREVELVHEVIGRLRFKQREVFMLFELEGLSCVEIAALLDVPVGTVWTRLHHARRRFKELARKRLAREATR